MSGHRRCERNDGLSSLPSQRPSACPEVVLSQAEKRQHSKKDIWPGEGTQWRAGSTPAPSSFLAQ